MLVRIVKQINILITCYVSDSSLSSEDIKIYKASSAENRVILLPFVERQYCAGISGRQFVCSNSNLDSSS